MRWIWKGVVALWKTALGVTACMGLLTSVLVVGWTYRAMGRSARRYWTGRIPPRDEDVATGGPRVEESGSGSAVDEPPVAGAFREPRTPAACATTACTEPWPNWFVNRGSPRLLGRVFGSLWLNFRTGFAAIVNTWVLTLPACVLLLFSWYAGWQNSFHKVYEHAAVGISVGLGGIALFIAAMTYLPVAQARQAATGSWRSFYDFHTVRAVIRRRWWACLGLAGAYALASLPLAVMKAAPAFFDRLPGYAQMSDADVLAVANRYFFFCCCAVFPLYVLLHLVAARIYASGLVAALRAGVIEAARLSPAEAAAAEAAAAMGPRGGPENRALRAAAITGSGALRFAGGFSAAVLWFLFVAQIYVSEFFNYHPRIGWLNQPLVQLPFFRYTPGW